VAQEERIFYTMEENKAKEGLVNGSWGIVSDLHNYVTENQSMKYVPLGPLNTVKGKFRVEKPYNNESFFCFIFFHCIELFCH
jgi:putative aldouronate transport system substrate-binding protein